MPTSRKHHPESHRKNKERHDPLALDRMLDLTIENSFRATSPPVLYHYTKWVGADGILRNQSFRATAHDCTNDDAELVSANDIIVEVAEDLLKRARGVAHYALKAFTSGYPTLQVAKLMTVYLACFSVARDDASQWWNYGDRGAGVCLGLRMLNEPGPTYSDRGSRIVKVEYSEAFWRADTAANFREVCARLQRAPVNYTNILLGRAAFYRIAAIASMVAKQEKWAAEHEYRYVTIIHKDASANPEECNENGKRYLQILVRADGKRMALEEIIIGHNQDVEAARFQIEQLLSVAGYEISEPEYPRITVSEVTPTPSPPD